MKYEKDLGEIISIITKINPEKIYLLGSYAVKQGVKIYDREASCA